MRLAPLMKTTTSNRNQFERVAECKDAGVSQLPKGVKPIRDGVPLVTLAGSNPAALNFLFLQLCKCANASNLPMHRQLTKKLTSRSNARKL